MYEVLRLWLPQQSPNTVTKSGSLVFSYSEWRSFSVFPQAQNLCNDRNTRRLYRPKPPIDTKWLAKNERPLMPVETSRTCSIGRRGRNTSVDRLQRSTALVVANSQKWMRCLQRQKKAGPSRQSQRTQQGPSWWSWQNLQSSLTRSQQAHRSNGFNNRNRKKGNPCRRS